MSGVRPETMLLLAQLHKPKSIWPWQNRSDDRADVLKQIGKSGDLAAAPVVLPLVFDPDREVAYAAAAAVHQLLSQVPRMDLASFSDAWHGASRELRWDMSPADLPRLFDFGDATISLLGLATYHWSGYVREVAVKQLANISDGSELPFLLDRLNDWVEQVRSAATKAIETRLIPEYARHFAHNIGLVMGLRRRGRADHSGVIASIVSLLQRPEGSALLIEGTQSPHRIVRKACLEIAFGADGIDRKKILRAAATDDYPMIRLWAARTMLQALAPDELLEALSALQHDDFAPVRSEALRAYVREFPGVAQEELRSALLDPSGGVRGLARYYLAQMTDISFAEFYRRTLESDDLIVLRAAIAGLAETGAPSDAELVKPYCSHDNNKVRRTALRAVAALDVRNNVELFLAALPDDSRRISMEARTALTGLKLSESNRDALWRLFRTDPRPHVRVNALRLALRRSPRGKTLVHLLEAFLSQNPEVSSEAWGVLHRRLPMRLLTRQQAKELLRLVNEYKSTSDWELEKALYAFYLELKK